MEVIMNMKSKIVGLLLVVCCLTQLVIPSKGVKAGENKSVEEVIDEIIEDAQQHIGICPDDAFMGIAFENNLSLP